MAALFERIEDVHRDWIAKQALFFVGTAPLDDDGHVNVSPKRPIGSLQVLDDHTVAYLDAYVNGDGYRDVQVTRNAQSIDGLPALRPVQRDAGGDEPDAAEVA